MQHFMFFKRKQKTPSPIRFHDFWEIGDAQTSASYQRLGARIEAFNSLVLPKPAINRWKWASIAVSVALLVVGALYWFALTHPKTAQLQVEVVYCTDDGTQIALPDGTKVWLSAHSQLRSLQAFTGKTRDVSLEGEGYFEVTPNKRQPFRVLVDGKTIVALGTSFNVRAYADETEVKVALVEGSVSVTDEHSGQAVILKPAQEASVAKNSSSFEVIDHSIEQSVSNTTAQETATGKGANKIAVGKVDLEELMSWKTGRYVFNNIPFEEITKMLERGFKVTILIENEALKSKPYTMRFENGESLERILDLIQINAKYSYQYNNGVIVIK